MKPMNLFMNMDAKAWAKEFCKMKDPAEEDVFVWFANAIMTGFDTSQARQKEKYDQLLEQANKLSLALDAAIMGEDFNLWKETQKSWQEFKKSHGIE
jgi:hypothetical protein